MPAPQPNAPPAQTAAQQKLNALKLEILSILYQMGPDRAADAVIAFMQQPPPAGMAYADPGGRAKYIGTPAARAKLHAAISAEFAQGSDEGLEVLEATRLSGEPMDNLAVRLLAYLKVGGHTPAIVGHDGAGGGGALMIAGALLLAFLLFRNS